MYSKHQRIVSIHEKISDIFYENNLVGNMNYIGRRLYDTCHTTITKT